MMVSTREWKEKPIEKTLAVRHFSGAWRFRTLFVTGKKDIETTIGYICNKLDGLTFTDDKGRTFKYIEWNDSMYVDALPYALKLLFPEYISKIESLTPDTIMVPEM